MCRMSALQWEILLSYLSRFFLFGKFIFYVHPLLLNHVTLTTLLHFKVRPYHLDWDPDHPDLNRFCTVTHNDYKCSTHTSEGDIAYLRYKNWSLCPFKIPYGFVDKKAIYTKKHYELRKQLAQLDNQLHPEWLDIPKQTDEDLQSTLLYVMQSLMDARNVQRNNVNDAALQNEQTLQNFGLYCPVYDHAAKRYVWDDKYERNNVISWVIDSKKFASAMRNEKIHIKEKTEKEKGTNTPEGKEKYRRAYLSALTSKGKKTCTLHSSQEWK